MLLAPPREVVGGDEPLRGARDAAVAVEAGADEGLVGEVRADEQAGDPVEERRLGQRARGRQQAVDGPLDPVGERRRRPPRGPRGRPATSGRRRSAPAAGPRRRRARPGRSGEQAARRGPATGSGRAGPARRVARAARGGRTSRRRWPGAVEADEDLAQEPREAHRLAPELEDVDRGVDHGPRGVLGRERRGRLCARAARTGGRRARRRGRPPRPGPASARRWRGSAARPARRPSPGGTQLHDAAASSRPASGRRAPTSAEAGADAAEDASRPASRGRRPRAGTRPGASRLVTGSIPRSARVTAAACQPHDGRTAGPNSGSRGSVAAASRPSTQAVAW